MFEKRIVVCAITEIVFSHPHFGVKLWKSDPNFALYLLSLAHSQLQQKKRLTVLRSNGSLPAVWTFCRRNCIVLVSFLGATYLIFFLFSINRQQQHTERFINCRVQPSLLRLVQILWCWWEGRVREWSLIEWKVSMNSERSASMGRPVPP